MIRWSKIGMVLLATAMASAVSAAADVLYWRTEGGVVAITNIPGEPGLRPLFAPPRRTGALPSTIPAVGRDLDEMIDLAAREAELPVGLVRAVVQVESNFDARAVSHKGASGLMQLMPATARAYGVRDVFDPLENLRAGSRHLRSLIDEFGDERLALAAYNAGAGAVRRSGGIPNYRETQDYVRKVQQRSGRQRGQVSPADSAPTHPAADVQLHRSPDGRLLLAN